MTLAAMQIPTTAWSKEQVQEIIPYLTPEEKAFIMRVLTHRTSMWHPLPGPQTMAFNSQADVIGFGGAAGGGKSDLGLGLAITKHRKTAIFRREGTQLTGITDRLFEIIGSRDGYSGKDNIYRMPGAKVQIEFGSAPHSGDETRHQGRPKDMLMLDEATNFLESQVRFLMGWVRSVDPKQRKRVLMTFNPPTDVEGRWVIEYFAPWLDDMHLAPAQPGELRWFATDAKGKDLEVPDGRPFVWQDGKRNYKFNPKDYLGGKRVLIITPQSRTFIPSRVTDNPHLAGTNYMATLQSLPEPLRSQMLYGDFKAGMKDDAFQVIPTAWVDAAMARWKPKDVKPEMDQIGVDVARGGADNTVISRRHGNWFDELLVHPGTETPDGPTVAGLVVTAMRDSAPINIDVIGVGASPYDFLNGMRVQVMGVNVAMGTQERDLSAALTFPNVRTLLWWRMREALDPANNLGIALPNDKRLRADLCTPKWKLSGREIQVESREQIMERLKRSADYASAVVLALMDVPKISVLRAAGVLTSPVDSYDPLANF